MKTYKYFATTAACIIMSLGANAQKNISNAIDDFINNKNYAEYIKKEVSMEQNSTKDQSYCYAYTFELPLNKSKALSNIQEAFNTDASNAYNVTKRSSGISDKTLMRVSYGRHLDKDISFGSHIDRNYEIMLFHDSNDSLYRYVYAIIWKEKAKEDKVWGRIYKVYGKDPKKVETASINTITVTNENGRYNIYSKDKNGNLKELFNVKGNSRVIRMNPNGQIITFNSEASSPDNSDNRNSAKLTIDMGNDTITNDMEFLQRFGNLRAAYQTSLREGGVNDTTLNTVLVNKIVELCKSYGHLLTDSEKSICIDSIKEMQKLSVDNYLKALLNEAINGVKK